MILLFCYLVVQSFLNFCNSKDCCPPDSSVHGISHTKILEWVTISCSRGASQPRDRTQVSYKFPALQWILYHWATLNLLKWDLNDDSLIGKDKSRGKKKKIKSKKNIVDKCRNHGLWIPMHEIFWMLKKMGEVVGSWRKDMRDRCMNIGLRPGHKKVGMILRLVYFTLDIGAYPESTEVLQSR